MAYSLDKRVSNSNYSLLDENGIVRKDILYGQMKMERNMVAVLFMKKGDVIIGCLNIQQDKHAEIIEDSSIIVKKGEEGFIDRIFKSTTPNGYQLIKIVIRKVRIPEVGDKFASRAAQKGTVGMVYNQEDMPWTQSGMVPDIIINPHCIPSRMTINQLLESVLGKSCAIEGDYGDATPFTSSSVDVAEKICDRLGMNGYERSGKEMLYNGFTGEPLGQCFIGSVYYQRLKHLVFGENTFAINRSSNNFNETTIRR